MKFDTNIGNYEIKRQKPIYKLTETNKTLKKYDINEIGRNVFGKDSWSTGAEFERKLGCVLYEIITTEFRLKLKNYNLVKELLEKQFLDVDLIRNFLNQTLLHYASEHNDLQLGDLLVQKGADFFVEDNYRQTPLIIAAKRNYFSFIKLFVAKVKKSADYDQLNTASVLTRHFRSAAYHACYAGNLEIVAFLFSNFDLHTEDIIQIRFDLSDKSNCTTKNFNFSELNPLHVSCFKGHFELVHFLISKVNEKSSVCSIINGPINEFRDSTSLEEAFKGFLTFDSSESNEQNPEAKNRRRFMYITPNKQLKIDNYKKIINLLVQQGAKFSSNFVANKGLCKLLVQIFTGPNKDADFMHFLFCINYLFKFKLDELFDDESGDCQGKCSPLTHLKRNDCSLISYKKKTTSNDDLPTTAPCGEEIQIEPPNSLAEKLDEFFFKVYVICLKVIKDYKGICLNYYIDTLLNLHYSGQMKLTASKLEYLIVKNKEIYLHLLNEVSLKPLTLKSLCTREIRKSIRCFGIDQVDSLRIPTALKYELFYNSISKGYCNYFDFYSYFLYKEINKNKPV